MFDLERRHKMRKMSLAVLAVGIVTAGNPMAGEPKSDKQVMISVRLCEGDPLGSREEGTLKVQAEPRLITLDNQSCSFLRCGEMAIPDGPDNVQFLEHGLRVDCKPQVLKDGKIRLDIAVTNSKLETAEDGAPIINSENVRTITEM